jgi:hypothetical protein
MGGRAETASTEPGRGANLAWAIAVSRTESGRRAGIYSEPSTRSKPRASSWRIAWTVRPGTAGRRGMEDAMTSGNVVRRPAGANPARPGVSPPEPVASLATVPVTGPAKRRPASVWAVGLRPRRLCHPGCPGCCSSGRRRRPLRESGEEGTVSGGVLDPGTHEEDGPGTWEAWVLLESHR